MDIEIFYKYYNCDNCCYMKRYKVFIGRMENELFQHFWIWNSYFLMKATDKSSDGFVYLMKSFYSLSEAKLMGSGRLRGKDLMNELLKLLKAI